MPAMGAARSGGQSVRAQQATAQSGAAAAPSPSPSATPPPPNARSSLVLRVSQRIAAARAIENCRRADDSVSPPLFLDPYADLMAGWQHQQRDDAPVDAAARVRQGEGDAEMCTALDIIATAHVDRLLLNATAVAAVNRITNGDYRQVVLLGDAMDTRPYRLPLAPGTAIFMVAPAEAHAAAAAALASEEAAAIADAVAAAPAASSTAPAAEAAASSSRGGSVAAGGAEGSEGESAAGGQGRGEGEGQGTGTATAAGAGGRGGRSRSRLRGPRPPPGCLLRRVSLELQPGGDFSSLPSSLEAAGFRADRLSVWAVQGLAGLGLGEQDVVSLLAEAANCAAYHSLLLGELPPLPGGRAAAANALAECGLLGSPLAFGTPDSSYGRWRPEWGSADGGDDPSGGGSADGHQAQQRWLFASQQIRLSAAQMDTYSSHRAAAEEMDEDFFDNFS
ncbi:hypothetical protein PLESTB_001045600 [Pleodorina starrii]|uniref:Uncharacterized protein n=1 Tax=Pleodorina starrii TaxID=330485 RepID=A0A9W6BPQ5_9CHLO|nr:hypothetical protein PLESTM_001264100 [Pleodorina starrii]GLC55929.1 hypothetical protein PLESTB_001045600 [Pleodorina starrii]GLC63915.1 hypothetical protein PLESTF_000098100 [Pleodorina starrii]